MLALVFVPHVKVTGAPDRQYLPTDAT